MIVATAGHVDHGKTVLVKALTGIDTDRLPEEKRRGLTIEPGFAYVHMDEGGSPDDDTVLGFVDVPGHERFIRNMLAGVAAIDFALLVVAADDGPMTQTREHLDILDLLGIGDGAVALTKIYLVDDARVGAVTAQISELLAGTSLAGAPVFPVAAAQHRGVAALKAHLAGVAADWRDREARGGFRFAIDRCFSLPGAGLVVTGAVVAGKASREDRLVLSPQGLPVRIREIRAHDREASQARAGQRCALNIAGRGLEKDAVRRGDWLLAPALHAPVSRVDARIRLLPGEAKGLASGASIHIHLGAAETTGRVFALGQKAIAPGQASLVQLALDRPIGALSRDRLILRDKSAQRTIAGGRVIDPFTVARGRAGPERLDRLAAMDRETAGEALAGLLDLTTDGIDLDCFARAWNLAPEDMSALLADQPVAVFDARSRRFGLCTCRWDKALDAIRAALVRWRDERDGDVAPTDKALRAALPEATSQDLFAALLRRLIETGEVVRRHGTLSLAGHQPAMAAADRVLWKRLRSLLDGNGLRPPALHELASSLGMDVAVLRKRLHGLTHWQLVTQVSDKRFFSAGQVRRLAAFAEELSQAADDGRFTAGAFRDRSGIGRNLAIEVLEYFDRAGITRSDGEGNRTARGKAFPPAGAIT